MGVTKAKLLRLYYWISASFHIL